MYLDLYKFNRHYRGKKILITGHTGFKGSWLAYLLNIFGAEVYGISKDYKNSTFFNILNVKKTLKKNFIFDLKDLKKTTEVINTINPDYIFHLAAQALVNKAYDCPYETIQSNFISSLNLFEIMRGYKKNCNLVIITSDKCYLENKKKLMYSENDILGGNDPYSGSKASVEVIFNTYFNSYFKFKKNIKLCTVRAGNVIGGGDFSDHRILPDIFRAIQNKKKLLVRMPHAIRPWQHVLDPIFAYLICGFQLKQNKELNGTSLNIGPDKSNIHSVNDILNFVRKKYPKLKIKILNNKKLKEADLLTLDNRKAKKIIQWKPRFNFEKTISLTLNWYDAYLNNKTNLKKITELQIDEYLNIIKSNKDMI